MHFFTALFICLQQKWIENIYEFKVMHPKRHSKTHSISNSLKSIWQLSVCTRLKIITCRTYLGMARWFQATLISRAVERGTRLWMAEVDVQHRHRNHCCTDVRSLLPLCHSNATFTTEFLSPHTMTFFKPNSNRHFKVRSTAPWQNANILSSWRLPPVCIFKLYVDIN